MSSLRSKQLNSPTSSHLDRRRIRARLLLAGVTVSDVARRAGVDVGFVSHVFSGARSATTPGGTRVVSAACELTGMTWGELSAPINVRPLAA
jgi:transcriptional regulator with XRE-family HTH domain